MAVEEGQSGILRNHIHGHGLKAFDNDNVLSDARCRLAVDFSELKSMPMQVQWMRVARLIGEDQTISAASSQCLRLIA